MIKAVYEQHMGTDLTVVNAARCSFAKRSSYLHDPINDVWYLGPGDVGLIEYLARGFQRGDWDQILADLAANGDPLEIAKVVRDVRDMPVHWAPFGHCAVTIIETVPIFVARQRFKHKIGFVESEVSRRYVDGPPEFFEPDGWRRRAENVKQGSSDELVAIDGLTISHKVAIHDQTGELVLDRAGQPVLFDARILVTDRDEIAAKIYDTLLQAEVCPEQARMVLPQSMMTTYWATGSLYAWANAYKARSNSHAQKEIRDLAAQWARIISPRFPVSWRALTRYEVAA